MIDENSEDTRLRRQVFEAYMTYYYWRERELMLIKAQIEKEQNMTLDDLPESLTVAELRELDAAESKPPVVDEDCPVMTDAQLAQFKRIQK